MAATKQSAKGKGSGSGTGRKATSGSRASKRSATKSTVAAKGRPATKASATKKPTGESKPSAASDYRVRVRMYRQGLGDCFLLSFKRVGKSDFHMLIDCGVLKGTEKATERMIDVVRSIQEATADEEHRSGHLDLVVATHEHWDHLSGFNQARKVFDKIDIDRIWFAWTEDPDNPLARHLRSEREMRARSLAAALTRIQASSSFAAYAPQVEHLLGFLGEELPAAGKSAGTRDALEYLTKHPKAAITYCYPSDKPRTLSGVDDVRIYVLGPPVDEKLIKKSDPSRRHSEVYEQAFALSPAGSFFIALDHDEHDDDARMMCEPFEPLFRVSSDEAPHDAFYHQQYFSENQKWRSIDEDWLSVTGELALALDSDTNNTSLVLAIELGDSGDVLLFPADAQVGNWLSWEQASWTVRDSSGQSQKVTAADLLARTTLYKVGHHGSHNATMREKGLELMTSPDLVALIPVDKEMAKDKNWKMPFPPLLKRLMEKTRGRVILADEGVPDHAKTSLTEAEWEAFKSRCVPGDSGLYLDWLVL